MRISTGMKVISIKTNEGTEEQLLPKRQPQLILFRWFLEDLVSGQLELAAEPVCTRLQLANVFPGERACASASNEIRTPVYNVTRT